MSYICIVLKHFFVVRIIETKNEKYRSRRRRKISTFYLNSVNFTLLGLNTYIYTYYLCAHLLLVLILFK